MSDDPDHLIDELTLDEKASLLAGRDFWTTVPIERLGIPSITVTDGPAGARGSALLGFGSVTAVCVPCGTALGSTWDPELLERVGTMLGDEARTKVARVLLAPTVNLVRSPLGGRSFESYGEDPVLAGNLAAGFVRGVQSVGVVTTVKHFVGNEAEFERHTISSAIDERTLREVYLLPFELAVREGGALGLMTAYNRLDGEYCTDRADLLQGILRDEWGFDGFVITDWFGAGDTVAAITAGVDLEMPGPGRFYGPALADAVRAGRVDEELLDAALARLLGVFDRVGALDDPPTDERSVDLPEHRALAREAAAAGTVLLRNEGVLPLVGEELSRLAVIGPNADRAQIMGGGSAALRPHHRKTPLQALRERLDGVEVVFERGCDTDLVVPPLQGEALRGSDGEPGIDVEFFDTSDWSGRSVGTVRYPDSRILFASSPHPSLEAEGTYSWRARASYVPSESGVHRFTLGQAGRARLSLDGRLVLDGFADEPPPGTRYFGLVSGDLEADVELVAGRPVEVLVEYSSEGSSFVHGALVGCRPPDPGLLIERAAAAAGAADVAIVVVGTNDDWETEGVDRTSLGLPGAQDELVEQVLAANPRTVVVLNTGSAVSLPWVDRAPALVQGWFGGQEMADALVDVLLGDAEPGGRLSITFPDRIEHTPAFGNFPGERGEVRYGEGLLVGYRWYTTRAIEPVFPFGHGLSYTTFELSLAEASPRRWTGDGGLEIAVEVVNTGDRPGSEVVQAYVAAPPGPLFRPAAELRAFAKVHLAPGERTEAILRLDRRSFAAWDPVAGDWVVPAGTYLVQVGRSVASIDHVVAVEVDEATD